MPTISAPLPTGTYALAIGGSWPRSTASVTSSAIVAAPVATDDVVTVDQQGQPTVRRERLRRRPGLVEVAADQPQVGVERPDPVRLHGIDRGVAEHDGAHAGRPGRVGHALAEVAAGCHDDRPVTPDEALGRQTPDRQPRPAALERPDRVLRLDLDDDRVPGDRGQPGMDELAGRDELGGDDGDGRADRGGGEAVVGDDRASRRIGIGAHRASLAGRRVNAIGVPQAVATISPRTAKRPKELPS